MNPPARRTRFEERVRIEREFLVPVNQYFGVKAPLAGMTSEAIESWERRATALESTIDVAHIASLLREAAARAELLADSSRDVFEGDRSIGTDGLNAISKMMIEALTK